MSAQPERSASRNPAPVSTGGGSAPLRGRFPRTAKLLRHGDFQRVYRQGRRQFAPHMTLFYRARDPQPGAAGATSAGTTSTGATSSGATSSGATSGMRVGLTVGRVLGGAVERNRIKRRLREAIRANLATLTAAVDVVINPKKAVLNLDFATLRDEVGHALQLVQHKARSEPQG